MIPSFSPLKPLHSLSPGSQPSWSPEMEREALRVSRARPEPRAETGLCSIINMQIHYKRAGL